MNYGADVEYGHDIACGTDDDGAEGGTEGHAYKEHAEEAREGMRAKPKKQKD